MIERQETLFGECQHLRTHMILMSAGPHYAKLVCSDCDTFLRWEPKPETLERQLENSITLTALSKLDNLTSWEREFVRDIVTHKHTSPRQQSTIDLLRDKYLKDHKLNDGEHGNAGA